MCFPNKAPNEIEQIPASLLAGLSIEPIQVLLNEQAYFAIYQSTEQVQSVKANNELLKKLAPYDVVVTAKAEESSEFDFISRYFWPANGGDEDPVTGSIHTGLAPYWADKLNRNHLIAYQASKRGGKLICKVKEDKFYISGQAVHYLTGQISI